MDGLEKGDVVVEDEVDTCPLLRGTLAYIYIWYGAQQRAKRGEKWDVNFEHVSFKTSNLPASSVGWCQ